MSEIISIKPDKSKSRSQTKFEKKVQYFEFYQKKIFHPIVSFFFQVIRYEKVVVVPAPACKLKTTIKIGKCLLENGRSEMFLS